MTPDEEEAQKARAERLRKQIENLAQGDAEAVQEPAKSQEPKKAPAKTISPREFIHRRMRELGRPKEG
jgi:hypothetical protein